MTGRLLRRLRRNAGSVIVVFARSLLARKNLLALAGLTVGILAAQAAVGSVLAGDALGSLGLLAVVGTALYGGLESYLGNPLRGAAVMAAGLAAVGGAAYGLGAVTGSGDTGDDGPLASETVVGDSGQSAVSATEAQPVGRRAPWSYVHSVTGEYECSDFTHHNVAQEYYENNRADHLDHDGDGVACERLPGTAPPYPND